MFYPRDSSVHPRKCTIITPRTGKEWPFFYHEEEELILRKSGKGEPESLCDTRKEYCRATEVDAVEVGFPKTISAHVLLGKSNTQLPHLKTTGSMTTVLRVKTQ